MLVRLAGLGLALCFLAACDDPAGDSDSGSASFPDAVVAVDRGTPDLGVEPVDSGFADNGFADNGSADNGFAGDGGGFADAIADDAAEPIDTGPRDSGVPVIVVVTVTPTVADLISIDGSQPTQNFSVSAEYSDGSTLAVTNPSLRVDPVLLGTISSTTGIFTASGRLGGEGRIIATVDGIEGFAIVRIRLEQTIIVAGTPTTAPSLFNVPGLVDPTRAANVVYPLDGAVMPQNVPPAEIQWDRSAPGDVFRITLIKPNVRAVIFESTAVANYQDSWHADLEGWRRIAQSEPTEWAEISVDRWIAATREVIRGASIRIRFARAALLGSIYYWDIVRGRIVRINDGTTNREEFMPFPPFGCVGCHSISSSGRYMAGRFGGGENVAGVLDLTQNLSTNPPPMLYSVTSTTIRWWFSSWNPDDTRLIVSVQEQFGARGLMLVDPFRGRFLTPLAGTLPTGAVTQPAWSPDGRNIAYVSDTNSWGGEMTAGSIYVLPVTGPDAFGAPLRVRSGTATPGLPLGNAAAYPTWSPDSRWIAFAHGNSSRSESGISALYLMRADGSGLVRLDNASGGPNGILSYQPRFSPFAQDGYFWMTFLSRRDYGNARIGTRNRQQIWVSAVKASPQPGEDASEVAYWLPGQNTQSLNISAYWAPRACRAETESCTVDAECCSGDCDGVCLAPSAMCTNIGDACTDSSQCCNAVLCIDSICGG